MADKLTSQQKVQLDVLATLAPRLELAHRLIEELAALRPDETIISRLCRLLDEGKAAANSIGETALADTMGMMGTIARRIGDRQMKVRGLREGLVSLKINYEGAIRTIKAPQLSRPGDRGTGGGGPSASLPTGDPPAGPT
jgi:hypothetical protein